MRSFPLIRLRWSNEHIMAALFGVLLLYMLPDWLDSPSELAVFILLLITALATDAAACFIRHKRLVCSVSASVTACIVQLLTPGVPLWGKLIGVFAALLLGKYIWGGTGKNPLNPALTGVFLLGFLFTPEPLFSGNSFLYLPAMLLSLPFILFRPFAGIGLMSGMTLALLTGGGYEVWTVAINCIFFGCVIITDPVTVTRKPVPGLIGGFAAGIAMLLPAMAGSLIIGILIFNLISYLLDTSTKGAKKRTSWRLSGIKEVVPQEGIGGELLDLTGGLTDEREGEPESSVVPGASEILRRIEKHGVFGMGGAGFPTADKIKTVLESGKADRCLIINGVECDPGLIHDKWLLKNRMNEIYGGIKALISCAGFKKAYIAVKKNTGSFLPKPGTGIIDKVNVPDMYPAGAERILIEKVTGIRLDDGAVPAAEGILVLNVQTVLVVYDAVFRNADADTRYITVSDLKNGRSRVVKIRLGDRILEILEKVYPGNKLAFAGGGIMQSHMAEDEEAADRLTNYIAASEMPKYKESPQCSRCGLCSTSCPAGLEAGKIAELVDEDRISETSVLAPERCLGCGSCSYVCLAGRNLAARVAEAKQYAAAKEKG